MFGDLGHGLLMLAAAAYMVLNERRLARARLDEISAMLFGGRYLVLLMAVFSIFTGIIYNEFFSIPMTLFGPSAAKCLVDGSPRHDVKDLRACPELGGTVGFVRGGAPYRFGVDPVWHGTKAELPFLNSMKMKMSILLGVVGACGLDWSWVGVGVGLNGVLGGVWQCRAFVLCPGGEGGRRS